MTITNLIISIFEQFRMTPLAIDEFEVKGKQVLFDKINTFVTKNQVIKFSMLGFPFKSPNHRDKTISELPDLAEQLTIDNFKAFANMIKAVYPPGIQLNIVSDGLAFNDIMDVPVVTVDQYHEITMDMAKDVPLNILTMRDFFDKNKSLDSMRDTINNSFGITNEELERRILFDPDVNMLYKGMIKFMNLDLAIRYYSSNSQLQKASKKMARDMMFRNESYSKLVQTEMSDHIRLSMHPSINNGTKFSFQLIRSPKVWTSAWHCAILITKDNEVATIHKKDAIASGFELVNNNNQFYFQE